MYYRIFSFKRYIEQLLMSPFVLWGRWKALSRSLKEEYDLFFFFPGYGIGGAERVNAEIVKSFSDKKVIIFFTKKSPNDGMKHFFTQPHATIQEISHWTDNKLRYWNNLIYRGICSTYINRQKKRPVVFIGQCNFAYKLTPHLGQNINTYELIHMLDKKFTWVWAPFVKFIKGRVVVGQYFKKEFSKCYERIGIPLKYTERIQVIQYCLEKIPEYNNIKEFDLPLRIYYTGRGGPQKRIWLVLKIIQLCNQKKLPVKFKLAGSFKNEIPEDFSNLSTVYVGEIKGGEAMYEFHRQNDILLMTSAWEGFPIAIMEAMSYGSIALTTDVGAIPEFIKDGENGFLISDYPNESEIVTEAVSKIEYLCNNRASLKKISLNAYQYITDNFPPDVFRKRYRALLLSEESA